MNKVKVEVDRCTSILSNVNAELADLNLELSRRTDVEQMQLQARVEALDDGYEWRQTVDNLITHNIARYEAILPHLERQVLRADKTLEKMARARPAMSWRVREIDALLADLRSSGMTIDARDMSQHLWEVMLDKLSAQHVSN